MSTGLLSLDIAGLTNIFMYCAVFFTAIFIWQMISAMLGMGGSHDLDTHVDPGAHSAPDQSGASDLAFKLLSLRSILSSITVFCWSGMLYLKSGYPLTKAILISIGWGAVAMGLVAWLMHVMMKATSCGNFNIANAVGCEATVHITIPPKGEGEIRLMCGGAMTHLRARTADGSSINTGTIVRISKVAGPGTVEVSSI